MKVPTDGQATPHWRAKKASHSCRACVRWGDRAAGLGDPAEAGIVKSYEETMRILEAFDLTEPDGAARVRTANVAAGRDAIRRQQRRLGDRWTSNPYYRSVRGELEP
jgi:hypothetical protein